MQLREAELISIDDDNSVRSEKVHSILDDGRRDEHIIHAALEVPDAILHQDTAHLCVRHGNANLFTEKRPHLFTEAFHASDTIVENDHLSASRQLSPNRFSNDIISVGMDVCFYTLPLGWRRRECRDRAYARKREIERAWNGSRAHREDMYPLSVGSKSLFVLDTEPMLLIDDDE